MHIRSSHRYAKKAANKVIVQKLLKQKLSYSPEPDSNKIWCIAQNKLVTRTAHSSSTRKLQKMRSNQYKLASSFLIISTSNVLMKAKASINNCIT